MSSCSHSLVSIHSPRNLGHASHEVSGNPGQIKKKQQHYEISPNLLKMLTLNHKIIVPNEILKSVGKKFALNRLSLTNHLK